jgi:thiamine biosynthesis protein ThiI
MNCVVARYGEIGIKARWVRRQFERKLAQNVSTHLKKHGIKSAKVKVIDARIYVYAKNTINILKLLADVPGIVSYSPVQITENDIERIKELALRIYKKSADGRKKSFRITCSRSNKKFEYNSQQVAEKVGAYIVNKTGAKVRLKGFDININIEIRDNAYMFSESFRGIGGLPIGSQERCICLLSDINSAISAIQVIRRGCKASLLHLNKSKKGLAAAKKFYRYISEKFYSCEEPLKLTVLNTKENCYTAAAALATEVKARAIVSGGGLGSIGKLKAVAKDTSLPILLPIVGMGTNEINLAAKRFGLKR